MEFAFETLDLELVGASHRPGNGKSKRAIEKYIEVHGGQYDGIHASDASVCSSRTEASDGVLRNWIPKDGEVRDLHRHTVTREQYRKSRE